MHLSPFSVLKTFIHDPLVEWEKIRGKLSGADTTNEKVYTMSCICTRLTLIELIPKGKITESG